MEYFKRISSVLLASELIGLGFVSIWRYGKQQYYKGRIDAAVEMKEEIEKLRDEFEKEKS